MSNTIDSALIVDVLSDVAKTTLGNALAPLKAFTRDFSNERIAQTGKLQIPVATAGGTTQTNPTNFAVQSSTVSKAPVTVNHYSRGFGLSSAQINQRFRLEMLAEKELQGFAQDLLAVAFAPATSTNFTQVVSVASYTAITTLDLLVSQVLKPVRAKLALPSQKNLLLRTDLYSQLMPTATTSLDPSKGGFLYNGIYENTSFSGAESNVIGFGCSPDAIAVASMMPYVPPGSEQYFIAQEEIAIDGMGLSVQLNIWFDLASRSHNASFDVIFGAGFGLDANAGVLVKTTSGS